VLETRDMGHKKRRIARNTIVRGIAGIVGLEVDAWMVIDEWRLDWSRTTMQEC
jgi:hypothetical protein